MLGCIAQKLVDANRHVSFSSPEPVVSWLVGYKLSRVALGTRMVTCNITGASGFITGTKEIRTKLDICFPHGSGGVTYVVKASYFVLAYKLLCGDNKLKGGTRGITPFPRGTRLQLTRCTCARKTTPCTSTLRVLKYTATIQLSSVHIGGWYSSGGEEKNNLPSERRLNEMANLTHHCQFEYQNRGRINKIYLRELCFYVLLLTKHFSLCFPCT